MTTGKILISKGLLRASPFLFSFFKYPELYFQKNKKPAFSERGLTYAIRRLNVFSVSIDFYNSN